MRINPGIHSIQLGEITVTALNDGQFDASTAILVGITPDEGNTLLRDSFRKIPPRISVSCFLLEWPDRKVVIDFGAGGAYGGVLGHAGARLSMLGVAPEEIDAVLLTHGHIDHLGGLLSAGSAMFPRAALHAQGIELDHWNDPANDGAGPAAASLAAYASRTTRFVDGGDVLPGVTAMHLPGHTPGHSGFRIESGGEALLVWGDIVHLPAIQFANPAAGVEYDVDAAVARAARERVLDLAATDRLMVAGIHHDFPIFGHVARHGAGYAFEPVVWAPTSTGLFA